MNTTPETMRITSPTLHATIIFSIMVFVTIIVMAFVFQVEVVARGEGRIVPMSRVQVVQPEFSGRISAIHVRNGSSVEKGEVLIEFDPTDAIAALGTITAEQHRLMIETARIVAMVKALADDPQSPDFIRDTLARYRVPVELESHPFADEQRDLLEAQASDLKASLAQIAAREAAAEKSEAVTAAQIQRVEALLAIQSERLEAAARLFEQGTSSRAIFLDVQQVHTELEQERDVNLREMERRIAERTAMDTERRRLLADMRSSLLDRRAQIESRLATLAEEERAASRRLAESRLTAPVSGIVDQLEVFTIGGFANSGAELMRIVPRDAEIEVEGLLPNADIGFVEIGQRANLRLEAFPSERFGFVTGRVSDIAADSIDVGDGTWGYVLRVTPDTAYLEAGEERFALRPGMTVIIDVTTDKRRLISYFFAPILRTVQDAMGER